MRYYDITRTLQEAPVYPGDEPPRLERESSGNGAPDSFRATINVHAGTHADAFSHFLPDGLSVEFMPLERYCGSCRVIRVPEKSLIRQEDLRGRISGMPRVALCGGGRSFLTEDAAEYLTSCGVRTVLTDAVSIAPPDNESAVHTILMRGGTAIVENTVLADVPEGDYLLFAFPMKIAGADGAPVRAVLVSPEAED